MVACLFSLSFHERVPGSVPAFIIELKQILLLKIKSCKKSAKPTWRPRSNNEENYFEDFTGISDKKKKREITLLQGYLNRFLIQQKFIRQGATFLERNFRMKIWIYIWIHFLFYIYTYESVIYVRRACNLKKVQYCLPVISFALKKKTLIKLSLLTHLLILRKDII